VFMELQADYNREHAKDHDRDPSLKPHSRRDLTAQNAAPSDNTVFTPLRLQDPGWLNDESVVLTWEDSVDAQGPCVVYRAKEPITSSTFPGAEKLGTVPYGGQRYVDTPPKGDVEWFYAVLALDASGVAYEVFIPFKNSMP